MGKKNRPVSSCLTIGLMSGTSLDGIDAALVEIAADGSVRFKEALTVPFRERFRMELAEAAHQPEIRKANAIRLDALLGHLLADTVDRLMEKAGIAYRDVTVIGSHGLTIGHEPDPGERFGHRTAFTWQIGDGDVIAQRTGICTVSDFRRRDMAAGGEGAPLIPVLDQLVFMDPGRNVACLNIGGIANLTILPAGEVLPMMAFDTGPGNGLLDLAIARLVSEEMTHDPDGKYAASGNPDTALLGRFLSDPYFQQVPPKSTGRQYFGPVFLDAMLQAGRDVPFEDLVSTVAELTPVTIVDALRRFVPENAFPELLIVSGGGVHNAYFMNRLKELLPHTQVTSSATFGVDPDFKEAVGFALLGYRTLAGLSGNIPVVTGAAVSTVLGKISPGKTGIPSVGMISHSGR